MSLSESTTHSYSVFFHKENEKTRRFASKSIENILSFCDRQSLVSLRLVSPQWNYVIGKNYILDLIPTIKCEKRMDSAEIEREWSSQLSDGTLNCTIGTISLLFIPLTVASTGVAILVAPVKGGKSMEFIKNAWLLQVKAPLVYIPRGLFHLGSGLISGGVKLYDLWYEPIKDTLVHYLNTDVVPESLQDIKLHDGEEVDQEISIQKDKNHSCIIMNYF
jgi:hypothetical protein